jgi:adenylate cyclase
MMILLLARLRSSLRFLIVLAVAAGVTLGVERLGWIQPLDHVYYDYWHQFAGKRGTAVHSAVIAVDDATLLQFKDDPLAFWAPHWAQAMDTLTRAGVKTVGLDFIYTVSAEAWLKKLKLPDSEISRNYDSPLRAQFAAGNKILITHLVENAQGELELLLPPQDQLVLLPGGANDLGIANLYPDSDKMVRHFFPVLIPDAGFPGLGFGMQLALRAAGQDPREEGWSLGGSFWPRQRELRRIGYIGPPGSVPIVSMSKLMGPEALKDPEVQALKGRVVIIAANNAGTSDRHFTPYSRGIFGWTSDQMIGGEIHANIIETVLSGRSPRALPLWLEVLYVLAWIAVAAGLYLRLDVRKGLPAGLALALLCLVPAYFLFLYDWVLPAGTIQAGLGVAFLASLGLRLTGEERERARMKQMFGSYVSDEVVDLLLSERKKLNLGGESAPVTILFSDIRNFTTISEKLGAHDVVEMLNAYFSRVTVPILDQRGNVNKYIGDAVMAIFGAPVSYPDHARRALIAAVGMAEEARKFRDWMHERFPDRGLPEFDIGIGIHSGDAVVGNIGSVKRVEFTAIGDTVNAASRLEGVTKELKCVIVASSQTVAAAGPGVRTGRRDTVKVKGREEPIEVLEILGLAEDPAGNGAAGRAQA